ncbi:MAG: hypothetical protein ABI333_11175 [bacterium]
MHPRRLIPLLVLICGCRGAEDRFKEYSSQSSKSLPDVESTPSPLKSCSTEPRPQARWVAVPGAPITGELVRAYHVCLGEHVALFRLRGLQKRRIRQVVLEQELIDVRGARPPRRSLLPIARPFGPETVRYARIRWREGRENPGTRSVRLRLRAVDFADGKRWTPPPWPVKAPPLGAGRDAGAPAPFDTVDRIQGGIRDLTRSLRKRRKKMEH